MKWEKVTNDKKFGGLEIKRLLEHNLALLTKWWWRFNNEKSVAYNLNDRCWLPQVPTRGKSSIVWKDLCSIANEGSGMGDCILKGLKVRVNSSEILEAAVVGKGYT